MDPNAPDWLTARPIAHRGLHDAQRGIVENTLGAAEAAASHGLAIECDVQASADGEAMVFHDDSLDRLTLSRGSLREQTAAAIQRARFREGSESIPTFVELLRQVAGRAPVICEIKSAFNGDMRLAERVAAIAGDYRGPLALKSFDPTVVAHFRASGATPGPPGAPCPLGIVAEASYQSDYWSFLAPKQKIALTNFLHYPDSRPDFLSYCVDDLPAAIPFLLRTLKKTPVMAWTVRSPAQRRLATLWADQIVFEAAIGI